MQTTKIPFQMDFFNPNCFCCGCMRSLKFDEVVKQESGFFLCKDCHPNKEPVWLKKRDKND